MAAKSLKTRVVAVTRGELGVDFVGFWGLGLPVSGGGVAVLAMLGSLLFTERRLTCANRRPCHKAFIKKCANLHFSTGCRGQMGELVA